MKIGIMTFHRALNYGAVLQGYALVHFLQGCGFEVEIIDYRNDAIEGIYRSKKINLGCFRQYKEFNLKCKIKRLAEIYYLSGLRAKFDSILSGIISEKVNTENWSEVGNRYDFFITGSDQVFNKILTNDDMAYYLDGIPPQKRVSFAASAGGFDISSDTECVAHLKEFFKISLREQETAVELGKLLGKECYCHMDPVFLLKKEFWRSMQKLPSCRDRYVLVFSMNKASALVALAKEYAGQDGCQVVFLSPSLRRTLGWGIKQVWSASCEEFLGWICNAEYIFTDSFHGCAFSILYGKKFYVEADKKIGSSNRILNVLAYFHCEECSAPEMIGKVKRQDISAFQDENIKSAGEFFESMRRNVDWK